MPIYDYECGACASAFSDLRPMARSAEPAPCPACGLYAPRVIAAPRLALMSSSQRTAFATNERSSHEPRSTRSGDPAPGAKKAHGAGCSCCSSTSSGKTLTARDGSKTFPTHRPWMISH